MKLIGLTVKQDTLKDINMLCLEMGSTAESPSVTEYKNAIDDRKVVRIAIANGVDLVTLVNIFNDIADKIKKLDK
jgi:hypothetical protein